MTQCSTCRINLTAGFLSPLLISGCRVLFLKRARGTPLYFAKGEGEGE
jgi:hypothetical protein